MPGLQIIQTPALRMAGNKVTLSPENKNVKKKISIDDGTVVSNLKEERLEVIISDEQHAGGKAAEEWK